MSIRYLVSIFCVAALGAFGPKSTAVAHADEGTDYLHGTGPAVGPECPGPPPDARPLEYSILFSTGDGYGESVRSHASTTSLHTFQVRDRQQISDEDEYSRIFGRPSEGIDWSTSRILVVELTTVLKFGRLESVDALDSITQTADSIDVGLTSTRYGPCQGIAQKPEWFSYELTDLIILLPAKPAEIHFHYCVKGGCPPDIP